MKIRNSLIIACIALSSASAVYAAQNDAKTAEVPVGYVSAWGTTLDEMTAGLKMKSEQAGAKKFVITSAHAGNRYYGTAALFN
ncbi:DUF1471 domain-containing protein [Klebsiella pneumoniae]|uniref:DUF1471 domain-containing protein n=1 Tax=Klebsiella pneumoniae TaxID=573 RepID=UPI001BA73AD7|nr:DUF1471 domain-containing protein [Klebsiella pneumoniae]MBQ5265183.1 DUF1471 domain-containing protein [Klebsiella pneumoniae]